MWRYTGGGGKRVGPNYTHANFPLPTPIHRAPTKQSVPWFQTSAVFWVLYVFFWVFPRRLIVVCRRFGIFIGWIWSTSYPAYEDGTYRVFRNVGIQQTPGKYPNEYFFFLNNFYCTEINREYIKGYKLFQLPIYFNCHSSILVDNRGA